MDREIFQWFRLGPRGTQYVIEHLDSGKPLSNYLLPVVSGKGYSYALLPSDIEPDAVEDFSSGGKVGARAAQAFSGVQPIHNADRGLVLHIQAFLAGDESRVCVLENLLASPSDRGLANAKGVVICGPHVYHMVTSGERKLRHIVEVLRSGRRTLEFVGALTRCHGLADRLTLPVPSITSDEIEVMAQSVQMVLVGAYDGESVVAWSTDPIQ